MINTMIFGLQPRKGYNIGCCGGNFRYFDIETGKSIEFQWDGAGIDKDGSIVLIEEELSPPSSLHIQGHISRLVIMLYFNKNIKKVIWIVDDLNYSNLKKIVESWIKFFSKACNINLPIMKYSRPNGKFFTYGGVDCNENLSI